MRALVSALLVFLGGGLGSLLRYIVSLGAQRFDVKNFPLGTFAVNIVGCFAIGLIMAAFTREHLKEEHRLFLAVGILGGFTTFSAFAWESMARLEGGDWTLALFYILLSNTVGLAAAFGGARLALFLIA